MKNTTLLLLASALLFSCAKERDNTPRYELALSKAEISMHFDQTDSLAVVHVADETLLLDFVFTSSDTNVVQVSNYGVVSGISVGTATITASATNGTASATCSVTIVPYSNMYVEPPFKWDMTRTEALNHIAEGDLLRVISGGDIYAKWITPVDSIRYNFDNLGVFFGTGLYIDISTDLLSDEAMLFVRERSGTDYRMSDDGRHVFQSRHDSNLEIRVRRRAGSDGRISIVYGVVGQF